MRTSMADRGAALLSIAACCALAACASPVAGSGDWRGASRCQPQESPRPGDHPGDGPALSPEEILPDRARCPEAYQGGGQPSGAPTIEQPRPEPPHGRPRPNVDHGCAEGETLNGSPCRSVPGTGGVIYPEAPALDTDPSQMPNH